MKPRSRLQFTLGHWTALVAALAFLLLLLRQDTVAEFFLVASIIALLPVLRLVSVVIDGAVGTPCPRCARWTLRRLARARSYYGCSHCGNRYKRSGLGTWCDASGPEFDAIYRGKSRARPWLGFTTPEDHDDTTTGALLRNHRRRREKAPAPSFAGSLIFGWTSRARAWLGFTTPRDQGYPTTGVLLQNQQRRRKGPAPNLAGKPAPRDNPESAAAGPKTPPPS